MGRISVCRIAVCLLAVIVLFGCGGPDRDEGIALIDDLIACDPPGTWDRTRMVQNLEERGDEYLDFIENALESCRIINAMPPTPTPTARKGFSEPALELLGAYHELLRFKDRAWFHERCYGAGGGANEWGDYVMDLGGQDVLIETGITGYSIWRVDWEYCNNQGRKTAEILSILQLAKQDWLWHQPVPTPVLPVRDP